MNSMFSETIKLLHNSNLFYIIIADMEGKYSYINNKYKSAFENLHGNIIGMPYHITIHPDDTLICAKVGAKCFANPNNVFSATLRKHDGKGGYIITNWDYKAMFDEEGNPEGMFCIGYDITEHQRKKVELKTTQQTIQKQKEILHQIAYSQSHIVRKPVANILGLISVIEHENLSENTMQLFKLIKESALELDQVINETVFKSSSDQ